MEEQEQQQQDQKVQELERWVCDCGLWDSDLGACFSTIYKLELLSEVTLSFFCLNVGN